MARSKGGCVLIRLANMPGVGGGAAVREASAAVLNQALRLACDPAALQKSKLSTNRIGMGVRFANPASRFAIGASRGRRR